MYNFVYFIEFGTNNISTDLQSRFKKRYTSGKSGSHDV